MIQKLVIFGVGLIGGSFALALKKANFVNEIVGVGRSSENLKFAVTQGIIDKVAADSRSALADADLVLLAVPLGELEAVISQIAPFLPPHAVVTDTASTKEKVISLAQQHLKPIVNFVPGHPIAGAEKSGATAARDDLFLDKKIILTPLSGTAPEAIALVTGAWQACGAQVSTLPPQVHDDLLAAVSHLPHVLAFALVDYIASRADAPQLFALAAGGFRDFTRIAASNPEMWRDICLANRDALLGEIDAYHGQLSTIRAALARDDGAALLELFSRSRAARQKWLP